MLEEHDRKPLETRPCPPARAGYWAFSPKLEKKRNCPKIGKCPQNQILEPFSLFFRLFFPLFSGEAKTYMFPFLLAGGEGISGKNQVSPEGCGSNLDPHPSPQHSLLRTSFYNQVKWNFLLRRTWSGRGKNCSYWNLSYKALRSLTNQNQVCLLGTVFSLPEFAGKRNAIPGQYHT